MKAKRESQETVEKNVGSRKKSYARPALSYLGSVANATLGGSPGFGESGGTNDRDPLTGGT